MKKRLVLLALVLCFVLAGTACKKEEVKETKESEPQKQETTKTPEDSQTPETTKTPEDSQTPEATKTPEASQKPEATKTPEDILELDPTTVTDLKTLDTDTEDIELLDYIDRLGQYKGVEVEVYSTEVTEEEIDKEIKAILEGYPTYEELDVDAAADGNYVNIDFVGKIDGVAFSGGSAEDTVLLLGSNTYIDGFEDGIVGMKKGETKDLELTFPKDYSNTQYAGKDVVFTVTLNSIMKKVDTEYTDEFVKENFYSEYKLSTVEEMNEYIKTTLITQKKENATTQKKAAAIKEVVNDSVFKGLPQQLINKYYIDEYTYYEETAKAYEMRFETFLSYYGITLEEFKQDCLDYAIQAVKEDIVLMAICEAENMEITQEYYTEQINLIFKDYVAYYKDVDEFVEDNGGKDEVMNKLLLIKARDFVVDNATVVGIVDENTAQ